MPAKECRDMGGDVVPCPCDACVCEPTLSVNGVDVPLNPPPDFVFPPFSLQYQVTVCYGDAATPGFMVGGPGGAAGTVLDKIRATVSWFVENTGCGVQDSFEVLVLTTLRLEYDTGAAVGDIAVELHGNGDAWTTAYRYLWRRKPDNEICYTSEAYTERILILDEGINDRAWWEAQNAGCYGFLDAEPEIVLNCYLPERETPDPICP